MDGMALIFLFL